MASTSQEHELETFDDIYDASDNEQPKTSPLINPASAPKLPVPRQPSESQPSVELDDGPEVEDSKWTTQSESRPQSQSPRKHPIDQLTARQEEKSPAIIRAHHESEGRARRVYVNERRVTLKQKQREHDDLLERWISGRPQEALNNDLEDLEDLDRLPEQHQSQLQDIPMLRQRMEQRLKELVATRPTSTPFVATGDSPQDTRSGQSALSHGRSDSDQDDEAIFNPPTRARTLAARYPVRELDGCCRTMLLLHFEFAVYDEANKAGEQGLPFKRMDDLNEAIRSLRRISEELEADYQKVIPIWTRFLPSTKKRLQAQYEKKIYARQLFNDLTYTRSKLKTQDLRFHMLEQALELCLSDESLQVLSYDGTKSEALHLHDDLLQRLTLRGNDLRRALEQAEIRSVNGRVPKPMNAVKRLWKVSMSEEAEFREEELLEIWKECVKGVDIVPEEEKPLALRNANIVPEPSTQTRKGAREFADSSTISNSAMAWWSPLPGRRSTFQFARRASTIESDGRWEKAPDLFMVVGWFPGTLHEPIEICLQVKDTTTFLPTLRSQIRKVRGWRTIFSFKTVQGFGLYRCHPKDGGHSLYPESQAETVALSQFYNAISRPSRYTPQYSWDWADWVRHSFNDSQKYPFRSEISLRLVIKWSQSRLIIAATIPLLLSMAVGIWYMIAHDGVEGDSAAWTVASYIVTAGAFIIALLAVLSSLKDGGELSAPPSQV